MLTVERVKEIIPSSEMFPEELDRLYDLGKAVLKTHHIVELGTHRGQSLCCLGAGSLAGNKARLTAVDLWDSDNTRAERFKRAGVFDEFVRNVEECGLTGLVSYLKGSTDKMVKHWKKDDKIGLLHIDADHSYESVKKDYELWSPFVAKSGIVIFHDYAEKKFPDVFKYVNELVSAGKIEKIEQVRMLFVCKLR